MPAIEEENKRAARVALGFLSRFQEQSGNQMAVPVQFVKEHFSAAQLKRLQDAGALQENSERIEGVEKRVFDVAVLERLADQKFEDVRKARESGTAIGASSRGVA